MKHLYKLSVLLIVLVVAGASGVMAADPSNFAEVTPGDGVVYFTTDVVFDVFVLNVTGPGHAEYRETFKYREEIYYKLADECGEPLPDGTFRYQILLRPVLDDELKKLMEQAASDDALRTSCVARYLPRYVEELGTTWEQTGAFTIENGKFVKEEGGHDKYPLARGDGQPPLRPEDHLVYDDAIITGSICVGFDCANGESFGYCTQKYKENNLQVCFEDTSVGSFPTNDWKIQINDTTSGGASYFTIWDLDGSRRPFTIEAGAPAHSLYVEDYGRIGFGTSIPYVELHIKDGDTPTVRLDQDGSSGWAAQSWDLAGNETNFFIRDVTNGSKLSFRIQPNTPSSTLSLRSTGFVGVGTWDPSYKLDIEETDASNDAIISVVHTGNKNSGVELENTNNTWRAVNGMNTGNFLIYDATNDLLPFVIEPDTPNDTLYVDSAGRVGIGTNTPDGTLDVDGPIFQRGSSLHADYVFEPDYTLESIEEHADFMWKNRHLKAVPKARSDENGVEIVEIGSHRKGILEELEKAHIYIDQLSGKNKDLEERMARLEALLIEKQ